MKEKNTHGGSSSSRKFIQASFEATHHKFGRTQFADKKRCSDKSNPFQIKIIYALWLRDEERERELQNQRAM